MTAKEARCHRVPPAPRLERVQKRAKRAAGVTAIRLATISRKPQESMLCSGGDTTRYFRPRSADHSRLLLDIKQPASPQSHRCCCRVHSLYADMSQEPPLRWHKSIRNRGLCDMRRCVIKPSSFMPYCTGMQVYEPEHHA